MKKRLFTNFRRMIGIVLLACLANTNVWATLTADSIVTTASTSLVDGGKYVIGNYNGSKYLAATSGNWGSIATLSSAYVFTVHGSATAFYVTCVDGTLKTASAKSWGGYDNSTSNNIKLSNSGDIIKYGATKPYLKINGTSGFRWYDSGQTAVYMYQVGFNIFFTQPASGGSIAATSTVATFNNSKNLMAGVYKTKTVTLTATPPSGKTVNAWTVKKKSDNSDVTSTVLSGTTLTMPAYDVVVSVTWRDAASCAVNPTVGGSEKGSISCTTATINCNNGSDKGVVKGSCDISEWGFVYGASSNPTGNKTSKGTNAEGDVANFSHTFTNLTPGATYYVRAYAIVNGTTYYGTETSFTTKTITVTANNGSYGSVSGEGLSWTGSPNSGYVYASPAYTITAGNNTTVEKEGNTFTITSTSTENVEITINFEPKGCEEKGASSITSGTSTGYTSGPVDEYYKYSARQILYTKSDLGLAAGKKGVIKSIYFQYSYNTAMSKKTNVDIYLANTNLTSLSTSSYVPFANFTKVYTGALNCSGNGTWNEITFDDSFEYNGIGQLVVLIDDNSNQYDGSDYKFKYHSGVSGAQIYMRDDNSNIDPSSASTWTSANELTDRPNTKFCIEEKDMVKSTVSFSTGTGNTAQANITESSAGSGITLPAGPTPKCSADGWSFAGWVESEVSSETTTAPTLLTAGDTYYPASNITLYAVYVKSEAAANATTTTYTLNGNWTTNNGNWTKVDGNNLSQVSSKWGLTSGSSTAVSPSSWTDIETITFTGSKSDAGAGSVAFYYGSGDSWTLIESKSFGTSLTWSPNPKVTGELKCVFTRTNGNIYIASIAVKGKITVSTYFSNPTCCETLADINGEVEFTDPTTAVVTWDKLANVAASNAYAVSYRTGEAAYGTTNVGAIDLTGSKATCTITGLGCNTSYDIKIAVTAATGYCDKEQVIASQNSGKYAITLNGNGTITGGTFEADETSACDGATITLSASKSAGYNFNSWAISDGNNITADVLKDGYAATDDIVEITMPAKDITINASFSTISYDITYANMEGATNHVSNPANYTIESSDISLGNPTKEGFNFGGWFVDSDLAVGHEAGSPAIAAGSTGNKTFYAKWIADDKWNVAITTPSNGSISVTYEGMESALTSGSREIAKNTVITITATPSAGYSLESLKIGDADFTSGNTHTLTSSIVISATFSIINYSITYNNMEGATNHEDNVASYTIEAAEDVLLNDASKTGYHFDGWFTDNGTWENQIMWIDKGSTGNVVVYAKWTANTYQVTIDKNYGTAGTVDVTATFDAAMPSLTGKSISRSGYNLAGIFANNDGTGTKYYNADKTSAHEWDQAQDKTIYATWSPKNYTITLNNEGADTGHEGTASIAVTFDSSDNLTSAIDRPEKEGYKFCGYFTETGGAGTQLIGEDGNVIASVSNYTSSTKQWKKAGDVELHAFWKACHTVTWYVNSTETPEIVVHGEKVAAMPTPPTSAECDDAKKFVGWRAEKITGISPSTPDGIFTAVAGSPEVTEDVTFYAVFATETIGDIVLVKNINDLTDGAKVYIYSEFEASETTYGAVAKAYETGNNVRAVSGTVSNEKLTPGTGACAYTFGKVKVGNTDYYTFNDGTYYLYPSGSDKNYLVGETDLNDNDYSLFTVEINTTTGVASINSKGNTSRGKMQFNKNADTGDYTKAIFACYKSDASQTDVKLFKKIPDVYSDYVTKCASCDADATFTTALPAVSEEACTSATVTATGGLATLGSEGCNISDYGFVLGTATNPVLDGEGVTKLQVGTSNPTVGNDFSYDLTGLTKGTHYYVRAYAVNKHGVAYSSTKDFWTKDVSSIAITTAPTKTNYIVGETFDATGMVVTATLAGGATENVSEGVTYSSAALTAGTNNDFTVSYTLCETEKTATQKINVYSATVTEGTNEDKGVMAYDNAGTITISSLAEHTTVEFVKTNADIRDNGDGSFSIINPTGTVNITVNYVTAVQVAVKFYAKGTELTGLALSPYQSENFDMPDASAAASAMTAASVSVSDDVHFVGWSASDFPYQTSEPTMVGATGKVTAATNFYAVFSNIQKVRVDEGVITGSYQSNETEVSAGGFENGFVHKQVMKNATTRLQFHKGSSDYGYVYNKTAISNIVRIEVGVPGTGYRGGIPVYACSAKKTISGSALIDEDTADDRYIYLFPANTQYFWVKGNNDDTYNVDYIDIYYAPEAVYYTTQFQTLTFNKADGNKDKDEMVAKNKAYALTEDDAPEAVEHYTFLDKWTDSQNTYEIGDAVTMSTNVTLTPISAYETTGDTDIDDLPATVTEIVVTDGKNLNVNDDKTLDNLIVENGGKVTLSSNKLTVVGTFSIETTMAGGNSGQLEGATASNFEASEAYIDITLGKNGDPNQWHAFTVPFPVDVMNGIYDLEGNKLANEVNYAIMDYHGDIRAQGQYGWKKYRGVLVPGTFYIMATDGGRTTYRFKKTANGALVAGNSKAIYEYASSTGGNDNGWNGIGNPNLFYGKVNLAVQVLDPNSYTFITKTAQSTNFVVGTPFFYQATADGTMVMETANAGGNYAPARERAMEIKDVPVGFGNEDFTDYLYVTANEDALNEYETGKDLAKMTMTNTPKVAQIFGKAYNTKLSMVNVPMVNDQAEVALELYAPQAGTYTISVPTEREDASLYLTKDGNIIWDLTVSPYEAEFDKGQNNGYGLMLVRKAPQVTTGVETIDNSQLTIHNCQKVILNDHVYILRDGQLYDVIGKAVK